VQPDFATARFSLGAALVALGRPEEGITELEQAVKLRPNNIKAYGALARALAQTSRPQEAIQRYEQGLRVDPNSAELWGDVGVLKAKLGDMPQAIAAVQTALQLARAQGNTALAARYEQMLQQAPAAPDSTPLPAPALPPSSP
jgi:tetratricopeptide (TPR) repeat protein